MSDSRRDKKPPASVEDLADEAMEGWEHAFGPAEFAAMREVMADLYASHPVISKLGDEALAWLTVNPDASEQRGIKGVAAIIEAEVKKRAGRG